MFRNKHVIWKRVVIPSQPRPSSLKQPLIRNFKTRAILIAMSKLAGKMGIKILLSNNKGWSDHFSAVVLEGVGVDWSSIQTHAALSSKQAIKSAIKQWGNSKWQLRWAKPATYQQTKVWFPIIKSDFTPFIRRLSRYDLGNVIHFTTGYNNLHRYRCKVVGGGALICAGCVGVVAWMPSTFGLNF